MKSKERKWTKKKKTTKKTIARMNIIHPGEIERFSLRLLLLNIPGAKSFGDLKTVEVHTYNTYHEAAVALKL